MDIAAGLIDEGNVVLGIQLLEALCEEKALPHEMADRHLCLSQTLLEHTQNLDRAKDHALKAVNWIPKRPSLMLLMKEGGCDAVARWICYEMPNAVASWTLLLSSEGEPPSDTMLSEGIGDLSGYD